ncbi:hypothetical protein Bpfe_027643 [Biomphalaria pfeifferi]|uniref:Cysteine and tyrosine-rich protein 1 n=1 Tax=Biomphalaria pfeifferi TaxID=112525 RepID=A0AAD8EWD5_BIOPF|nr:hypothetical protein Bpfe_027643 [Biomphalaria pfeifferi]
MKSFTVLIVLMFGVGAVLGEMCTWYPTLSYSTSEYCVWGCCYTYSYPCCEAPIYSGTPFIVGMSVSGGIVVLAVIVAVCVRQRRRVVTSVQYSSPGTQNVFSTSTSTSVTSGYSNPGFVRTY